MLWLKGCPKCQGDLILDQDHDGKFKTCMQCGYLRDVVQTAVSVTVANTGTNGAMPGQVAAMPLAA